ncbi:Ger(x)C family spore germination protein [Tepidibacillus sp. LV47]|uniref:Ger(x)C family spore germination protein n=1 Tax=Tepidibacillus sp. LV47 TaxID=3398228 RepID=UPI003AAFF070
MNKRILSLFLFISFIIFFSTGCWNRRELNELAIVTAAGIDPGPKKGEITVVFQIVNPSAISGKQGVSSTMTPFITIKSTGKTVFDAVRKATREMSRRLYFAHTQAWIFNEELVRKSGIKAFLDFLIRDAEIRINAPVLVTKGQKAEEILTTQLPLDSINGVSIKKHLENAQKSGGFTRVVELRELINVLSNPIRSAIVPYVFNSPISPNKDTLEHTQLSKPDTVIKTEGFAVFKKDKLIGFLNSDEARGLLFVTDKVDKGVLPISFHGHHHAMEIIRSKTKMKTRLVDSKPEVDLEIKLVVNVGEVSMPLNLTNPSLIKKLETVTNHEVKKEVEHVIQKAQKKYKADIFGFGEEFKREYPKEWKKLENNWEKEFVDLTVNVKVNTTIYETGLLK